MSYSYYVEGVGQRERDIIFFLFFVCFFLPRRPFFFTFFGFGYHLRTPTTLDKNCQSKGCFSLLRCVFCPTLSLSLSLKVCREVQKHEERTPPKPDDEERREMPASSSSGVPFQSKLSVALCRALVKCSKRFEVQIQRLGLDALPETELTLLRYLCPNYLKSVQISASGDGEPPQGTPPTRASSSSA